MNPRRLCGVARGGYFSYSPRDIQKKKKKTLGRAQYIARVHEAIMITLQQSGAG